MLSQRQRIPKALAQEVFFRGQSFHSAHFVLKKLNSSGNPTRFAVSISKKVAKTAVLRNRTRRRVYSQLRNFLERTKSGYLVGVSVKKGGETLASAQILPEIESLLRKSGL